MGELGILVLLLILEGKLFTIKYDFSYGFSKMPFIILRTFPYSPGFLSFLMQFYTINDLVKIFLLLRNLLALIFWVKKAFFKSNPNVTSFEDP